MYSVTTTKTAAVQYTNIQSQNNDTPRITSTSDYFSSTESSRPTPREINSYQNQSQLQEQMLYTPQHPQQDQNQPQLNLQELQQQQIYHRPQSVPLTQYALEEARQISMGFENLNIGDDADDDNRRIPRQFGSANSARRNVLQSSMKKAASVLPVTTPSNRKHEDTSTLDRSSFSSLEEVNKVTLPAKITTTIPASFVSQKPKPSWRTFFQSSKTDDANDRGTLSNDRGPNPVTLCCFLLMCGVVLMIFMILICLIIARLDVRDGVSHREVQHLTN